MTKKILLLIATYGFTLAAAEYTIPTNNPNVMCTIKTEAQDQFEKILESASTAFNPKIVDIVRKKLNELFMVVDVQVKNTLDKPIKLPTVYFKDFESLLLSKQFFAFAYQGIIKSSNPAGATLPIFDGTFYIKYSLDSSEGELISGIFFGCLCGLVLATTITDLLRLKRNAEHFWPQAPAVARGIFTALLTGSIAYKSLIMWLSNDNSFLKSMRQKEAESINSFAQPATCSNGQIFPPDAPEYVIPPHETFHDHLFIPREVITKCNFEKTQLITG